MANKKLFSSLKSWFTRTDATNAAGGVAYALPVKQALAQLAATGCFHGTFYTDAGEQLDTLRALVAQLDNTNGDGDRFLAKLAVYSRERALMKDMPAALVAILAARDPALMQRVFDRVVDNGRVLRTLLAMIRSGQFGKKSLSSSLQRAFQRWLNGANVGQLLSASIGSDPSLRDVLRLARPTPSDNARRALFGWLTQKPVERWAPATEADLPEEVLALEAYRKADSPEAQALILGGLSVRWDLLADAARGPLVWKSIARKMGPQALRMNLNTLARHGVLEDAGMAEYVARRIADADEIRRSRQFPYQYLTAYLHVGEGIPASIKAALHKAAEIACGNVPALPGPVVIGLDVSGSMASPVTGNRGRGATSQMRCVDVAALFAAAILRRNPDSVVIPFDTSAYEPRIDASDSILSLSKRLAQYGGGGTDCSLPLSHAVGRFRDKRFAGCVLVSDNESWVYQGRTWAYGTRRETGMLSEWQAFVKNQFRLGGHAIPAPKLVCIDLVPNTTTQAPERSDILNIGGFSDAVFQVVSAFFRGDAGRFVEEVESIEL